MQAGIPERPFLFSSRVSQQGKQFVRETQDAAMVWAAQLHAPCVQLSRQHHVYARLFLLTECQYLMVLYAIDITTWHLRSVRSLPVLLDFTSYFTILPHFTLSPSSLVISKFSLSRVVLLCCSSLNCITLHFTTFHYIKLNYMIWTSTSTIAFTSRYRTRH